MKNSEGPALDLDAATRDPASVFASPDQVLDHPGLSTAQRIEILQRWEYDARELSVAEEEGMGSGEPSMLARVSRALARLPKDPPAAGTPSKHGGA